MLVLCSSKPGTKASKLYCDIFVRDEAKVWKKCIANADLFVKTYESENKQIYRFETTIDDEYYRIAIFLDEPQARAGVFDENDDCIACSFCKNYYDKIIDLLLNK